MQFQVKMNQLGFPYRYNEEILQRRRVQQAFNSACESLHSCEIEVPLVEPLDGIIGDAPKPLRESHLNLVFHGLCYFDSNSIASADDIPQQYGIDVAEYEGLLSHKKLFKSLNIRRNYE
jgi:hypothetical protein